MLMRSGYDYHFEGVRAYISGARKHLTENGHLLLGSGESADLQTIDNIAAEYNYDMICLRQDEMPLATWGVERTRYMLVEFVAL